MGRKSSKVSRSHHTGTNQRNVIRNQGRPGSGAWWRKQQKNIRRSRKQIKNKKIKFIVEFVLGIGMMVGIILALYIFSK